MCFCSNNNTQFVCAFRSGHTPQQSDAMGLLILHQESQKTLLVHKIRPEDQMYQRTEGGWRVLS